MLRIITGKPGMGKTLLMTYLHYKNFKRDNPPLKIFNKEKIFRKKHVYILNKYSDYPIVFKKPRKGVKFLVSDGDSTPVLVDYITSLRCRIFDLILDNKFAPNAQFNFDEIQAKYDSMEYKDFPDSIAHYCQAHRHFGNDINICSQSQSRIIKRLLVLAEEYWEIMSFRVIFGFAIVEVRVTWDMKANLENGVMSDNISDCEYRRIIFRLKKVGSMYDTCYLRFLQDGSTKYESKMFDKLQLNKNELLDSFFPSKQERERIKNMRY